MTTDYGCSFSDGQPRSTGAIFNNLSGSGLVVANLVVRAPLVGLFTGEIDYGRLPVEVAAFVDAGLVWSTGTADQRHDSRLMLPK